MKPILNITLCIFLSCFLLMTTGHIYGQNNEKWHFGGQVDYGISSILFNRTPQIHENKQSLSGFIYLRKENLEEYVAGGLGVGYADLGTRKNPVVNDKVFTSFGDQIHNHYIYASGILVWYLHKKFYMKEILSVGYFVNRREHFPEGYSQKPILPVDIAFDLALGNDFRLTEKSNGFVELFFAPSLFRPRYFRAGIGVGLYFKEGDRDPGRPLFEK